MHCASVRGRTPGEPDAVLLLLHGHAPAKCLRAMGRPREQQPRRLHNPIPQSLHGHARAMNAGDDPKGLAGRCRITRNEGRPQEEPGEAPNGYRRFKKSRVWTVPGVADGHGWVCGSLGSIGYFHLPISRTKSMRRAGFAYARNTSHTILDCRCLRCRCAAPRR